MIILSIDPGASGGVAVHKDNKLIGYAKFTTENDIAQFISEYPIDYAYLEEVHAMPGQGVTSMFNFGANVGFYRGVLLALKIPFETVRPQKWQKEMRCMTKGDKNISKARAQELYPEVKMTHALADAILIGAYGCRTCWKNKGPRVEAPDLSFLS